MSLSIYSEIAFFSWAVLILVWLPGYFTSKRTVARPNPVRRYIAMALIVLAYVLLSSRSGSCTVHSSGFGMCLPWMNLTPETTALGVIGLILDIVGVAFAIWARITIGSNWSNAITLKASHELVQSGPYAIVRHPIYTGMLVAMLGTALTIGSLTSYLGVVSFLAAVLIRIHDEDALMAKQFPSQHPEYKKKTKALIPFVW